MEPLVKELINNLEEQIATYKLLIDFGEQKQDLLVDGKISELESLIEKEQNAVFKNGDLERRRNQIIKELAEETGELPDDLTISRVIELSEGEQKERLTEIYRELEEVVVTLKDLNLKNNDLIQQSLSYIDYSLDILTGAGQNDPGTYTQKDVAKDSGKAKKESRSFLDKKI